MSKDLTCFFRDICSYRIIDTLLRIPKIQVTDHVKLKKKEDQSVDTLVLLRRRIKILMGHS